MRLLSSASIFHHRVKGSRHCSTTCCPTLDWKNHLVLGTEFSLCIAFLRFVPTLGLSSPGFVVHGKDPDADIRACPSL